MYLLVRGIDLASFYDFSVDFRIVSSVWIFLFFTLWLLKYATIQTHLTEPDE